MGQGLTVLANGVLFFISVLFIVSIPFLSLSLWERA